MDASSLTKDSHDLAKYVQDATEKLELNLYKRLERIEERAEERLRSEKARHELELKVMQMQMEEDKQNYETKLNSITSDLGTLRTVTQQMLALYQSDSRTFPKMTGDSLIPTQEPLVPSCSPDSGCPPSPTSISRTVKTLKVPGSSRISRQSPSGTKSLAVEVFSAAELSSDDEGIDAGIEKVPYVADDDDNEDEEQSGVLDPEHDPDETEITYDKEAEDHDIDTADDDLSDELLLTHRPKDKHYIRSVITAGRSQYLKRRATTSEERQKGKRRRKESTSEDPITISDDVPLSPGATESVVTEIVIPDRRITREEYFRFKRSYKGPPVVVEVANRYPSSTSNVYEILNIRQLPVHVTGPVEGQSVGTLYPTRSHLYVANVHRHLTGLAASHQTMGCQSLCLASQQADFVDQGYRVIVVASDLGPIRGDQEASEQFREEYTQRRMSMVSPTARRLRIAQLIGHPVRVCRSYRAHGQWSPAKGCRYDGLYKITDCWQQRGLCGLDVIKFSLERASNQPDLLNRDGVAVPLPIYGDEVSWPENAVEGEMVSGDEIFKHLGLYEGYE